MEKVCGKAIIANAIIREYKPEKIRKKDRDFFFEFESGSAEIYVDGERKSDESKTLYLYVSDERLGFAFCSYGGFCDSRVYLNHPKEKEIAKEIRELSDEFEKIRLPSKIAQDVDYEDFDLYKPLEQWSENFIEKFSSVLPEARVDYSFPAA
jgi:hypothetical protein